MGMGARYRKGSDFERFIVNMFFEHGWMAMRAAGSGKSEKSLPDVVALKAGRVLLIECKATAKDRLSLKAAMGMLGEYESLSGGEAYLAIRFFRKEARFYRLCELLKRKNFTITDKDEYMKLETVIGEQRRLG